MEPFCIDNPFTICTSANVYFRYCYTGE